MNNYQFRDDHGVIVNAFSGETDEDAMDALRDSFEDGDWDFTTDRTYWIRGYVYRQVEGDWELVDSLRRTVHPDEPSCPQSHDGHKWQSGECWGSGGGVRWTDTCEYCGCRCVHDTWAQDPQTGEQGLDSIEYLEAEAQDA